MKFCKKPAKKVFTKDLDGNTNGYLVELNKDNDLTTSYLTVAFAGCFKGFHLHTVRESNYICIKGKVKIILYTKEGFKEYILDSTNPEKLNIPINIPTGISNEWDKEAWLVNFPNPPYDPNLIDEQIDYKKEELTPYLWDNLKNGK